MAKNILDLRRPMGTLPQMEADADHRFMGLALDAARAAQVLGEVPIGAVIVRGGEVIATGHNRRETWHDPTAHAELIAIRRAAELLENWRLTGTTLYVTLEPCLMCMGAAMSAFIGSVRFALASPSDGAVGLVTGWSRETDAMPGYTLPDIEGGHRATDARDLFARYVEQHRQRGGAMWAWAATLTD